jgi:hypothetical protein
MCGATTISMGVSFLECFRFFVVLLMHEDLTCNSFDAWGFNFQVVSFGIRRFVDAWGK